ncbi:hypothetical protein HZA97_01235 [Candidatus Woesearchaeota archaeon]|nr:hypothetical protein [Candidatus Woesearchaeota archaeon]
MTELEQKLIYLEGYNSREEIQKCYFSNYLALEDKARETQSHYLAELKIDTIQTNFSKKDVWKQAFFSCNVRFKRLDRKPEITDLIPHEKTGINQLIDESVIWEINLEKQTIQFYKNINGNDKGNNYDQDMLQSLIKEAGEKRIYISPKLLKESFSTILLELDQVFNRIIEFAQKEGEF